MACKVKAMTAANYAMIKAVEGFSHRESKRIDDQRQAAGLHIRCNNPGGAFKKKAEAVSITKEQAACLKSQPDTPQGRRDALMMCLFLDHGLRCGEVAALQVEAIDLATGMMTSYRSKVDLVQTHRLSDNSLRVARSYIKADAIPSGPLLRESRKGGKLMDAGMSERAITQRVHDLGVAIGIEGLSAHDLRHAWATIASRNGTPLDRLQDAGGWSSLAMPLRYVERAKVANNG